MGFTDTYFADGVTNNTYQAVVVTADNSPASTTTPSHYSYTLTLHDIVTLVPWQAHSTIIRIFCNYYNNDGRNETLPCRVGSDSYQIDTQFFIRSIKTQVNYDSRFVFVYHSL